MADTAELLSQMISSLACWAYPVDKRESWITLYCSIARYFREPRRQDQPLAARSRGNERDVNFRSLDKMRHKASQQREIRAKLLLPIR